jgi:hypothetical protein
MIRLLSTLLVLGFASAAQADGTSSLQPLTGEADHVRDFDESYAVARDATIDVTHAMGDLTVKAWDEKEVRVQARLEVKCERAEEYCEAFRLEVEQAKDVLRIVTRYPEGDWGVTSIACTLDLFLPQDHPLHATISLGNTEVKGLHGPVRVRSSAGDVDVRDVVGPVQLTVSLGSTAVRSCRGPLEVTGSTSDITIEDVRGDLEVKSALGHVNIAGVSGDLLVQSSNGNIALRDFAYSNKENKAGNRIELGSSLGLIEITLPDPPSCELSASTSFGSIESDFDLDRVTSSQGAETASARLGKALARIDLNASHGSIRIKKTKSAH